MIFISYAHAGNQTFNKEQKGWIELLHERLDIRVKQLTGKRQNIAIWRDKKLQGNDYFGDEIIAQLERARILVSILSPSYVTSEWCLKELNFLRRRGGPLPFESEQVATISLHPRKQSTHHSVSDELRP